MQFEKFDIYGMPAPDEACRNKVILRTCSHILSKYFDNLEDARKFYDNSDKVVISGERITKKELCYYNPEIGFWVEDI